MLFHYYTNIEYLKTQLDLCNMTLLITLLLIIDGQQLILKDQHRLDQGEWKNKQTL